MQRQVGRQKKVIRSGVLLAIGGIFMAGALTTLAETVTWTDTAGDHNLYNENNWNPTGSPQTDDWVFDDSSSGTSTQAVFGAGTPEYPNAYTITFSKTGGFIIKKDSEYRNINYNGGTITVTKSGETYTIEPAIGSDPIKYHVTTGATLVVGKQVGAGVQNLTGGGTVRHYQENNPNLNLALASHSVWEGNSAYAYQVQSISGTGTVVKLSGNELRLIGASSNLTAFAGWIYQQSAKISWESARVKGAKINFWPGARLFNNNGELPAQGGVQPPVKYFDDCLIAGAGEMIFASGQYGQGHSGSALTGQFARCTFAPGTNVTANSAGIFKVSGNARFAKVGDVPCTLHVDVLSAGETAGTHHDQLMVAHTATDGGDGGGGDVLSVSDANNRLADVELVVDTTSVAPAATFAGLELTILKTSSDLSGGVHTFSKVTWLGPYTGTVNYENQQVTLSNIRIATTPATTLVIIN